MVCPRRDWRNTFFVHEGPRRNTKNCNGNTFVHGGHGGPRRTATATATSFCPRRAAKGHEENLCQIIIWSVHEGTRGTPFLSTKGHEGTRRTATATHLSTEDTEGRGELQRRLQLPFVHGGPRSATKKTFARSPFLSTKGHEGTRRTATATHLSTEDTEGRGELQRRLQLPFVHGGPRSATKKTFARSLFGLSTKGRGEHLLWWTQIIVVDNENQARNGLIVPAGVLFLSHCEQSSLHVNGTWSVVRTFGPGVDQEIDFGNIDVILPRNWDWPVERRRI